MKLLDNITPIEKDFGKWYQDVVVKGNMINYGRSQGSIIFKPISYGIWENITAEFNKILKNKLKAQNVKLPLLIPISYIEKEKKHIKGFAPELATITKVGNKDLDEHLVIRPTSEVLFTELFADEINSYKDLPIIFNQWANVLRWEKKTSPFLRNREFMWQEGHTAHSFAIEAQRFAKKVIKIYEKFLKEYLAIPSIIGKKTPKEKFAGAVTSYTIESMMKDGKALQTGTSHYLGQNFSKSFNAEFKNSRNEKEWIYQTSWGISTRLIGAIIMSHGDNRGVIIPPKIAPFKVDIIEIFGNKNKEVAEVAKKIYKSLRSYKPRLDNSNKSLGNKVAQSEIEGTPIRIEVGPRDLKENKVVIVRRDTLEKKLIDIKDVKHKVKTLLDEIQNNLLYNAKKRIDANLVEVDNYKDFLENINKNKFVKVPFSGTAKDENKIKSETGASTRCIVKNKNNIGTCIITKRTTKRYVIFAKAY